jgi:protein-L-isoaspartate(D-aspartate) O-methyltransferase
VLAFSPAVPHNRLIGSIGMIDFQAARRAMIDGQLRSSDVTDLRVLAAMLDVPREVFVPERLAALAHLDRNLPIDEEDAAKPTQASRFLVKPMVQGRLIQALAPAEQDNALVVGCGTGYSAAVIGRLAAKVTALEENNALSRRAQATLGAVGADKVTVVTGPLAQGFPGAGPHDVILIDGGAEFVPDGISLQLAKGGRLAVVICDGAIGKAMIFHSDENGMVSGRGLFDATVPPLPGLKRAPAFVF